MVPLEYANVPLLLGGSSVLDIEARAKFAERMKTDTVTRHDGRHEVMAFVSDGSLRPWVPSASTARDQLRGGRARPGSGAVVAVPIHGPITTYPDLGDQLFGYTDPRWAAATIRQLTNDTGVSSIILDIDSPGGTVPGIPELAAEIRAADKVKPVHAVANHMAASAAYWVGAQARRLYVTPAGVVGGIGALMAHVDISRLEEKAGQKTDIIVSEKSPYKAERSPFGALSPEARADMQKQVNHIAGQFAQAVAEGRKTSRSDVEASYGRGRVLMAGDALRVGAVDAVATLEEVGANLLKARAQAGANAATRAMIARDIRKAEMARIEIEARDLDRKTRAALGTEPRRATRHSGRDLWIVCVHEAGHVLGGMVMGVPVLAADVTGSQVGADGSVHLGYVPDDFANAVSTYCGPVAEEVICQIAPFLPGGRGSGDLAMIDKLKLSTDDRRRARQRAYEIVAANTAAIDRLAMRLATDLYLTGDELWEAVGEIIRD